MKLYGEELFKAGILLMIVTAAFIAVFACIYMIKLSRLKKQMEREYGSKNK